MIYFNRVVKNENALAQPSFYVWKANKQDIIHSALSEVSTIEPESLIETAWDVIRNLYLKVVAHHIP